MSSRVCSNQECSAEFVQKSGAKGLYCSRSCAATINNSRFPKRKKSRAVCPCGTEVVNKGASKYCSSEHSAFYRRLEKIQPWLDGEWDGSTNGGGLSRHIRRYLLDQADNKCTRCGWGEVNPLLDKPILTIDHIDGDWRNNMVDNLRVLCYNCHTLTPTFNALNKGNAKRSGGRQYNHRHLAG